MRKIALFSILGIALVGCSSNPTNEPTTQDINNAVQSKFDAIDKDPNLTAEQKAEMKKHMSGPVGQGSDSTRK
jgi:uncharacterized protein YcfL